MVLVVKNPPANTGYARGTGSILGSGRSPGGGNGNRLQYSCLENSMDRGACRATVYGVARLSNYAQKVWRGNMKKDFLQTSWLMAGPWGGCGERKNERSVGREGHSLLLDKTTLWSTLCCVQADGTYVTKQTSIFCPRRTLGGAENLQF